MAAIAAILTAPDRPGDRPRGQVPRALRADHRRARVAGPLGRGGRLLLRPAAPARRHGGADQGALDRRRAAAARRRRGRRGVVERAETLDKRAASARSTAATTPDAAVAASPASARSLLGVVGVERVLRASSRGCSTRREFLSPYGLRARLALPRGSTRSCSTSTAATRRSTTSRPSRRTGMFGGNSNWRGPVWMPVNYLVVEALSRYARFFGDDLELEYPTGLGPAADARRRSPTTCASG